MRAAGDRPHGRRCARYRDPLASRAPIHEALELTEGDLDEARGALLVRRGKGGRRREVGMDGWAWEELQPGSSCDGSCRSARCCASSPAHRRAPLVFSRRTRALARRRRSRGAPTLRAHQLRHAHASRWPAKACRSSSSSASSAIATWASLPSTCKASTTPRSSTPFTPAARRWSPYTARCAAEGSTRPAAWKPQLPRRRPSSGSPARNPVASGSQSASIHRQAATPAAYAACSDRGRSTHRSDMAELRKQARRKQQCGERCDRRRATGGPRVARTVASGRLVDLVRASCDAIATAS